MATTTHQEVLETAVRHLRDVFEASPDGVYVWVDGAHKDCNEACAEIWGRTVDEWRGVEDFLGELVADDDREAYGRNYQDHVGQLSRPVRFRFGALQPDGSVVPAETDMIPLSIDGHAVAYHFVRRVEE